MFECEALLYILTPAPASSLISSTQPALCSMVPILQLLLIVHNCPKLWIEILPLNMISVQQDCVLHTPISDVNYIWRSMSESLVTFDGFIPWLTFTFAKVQIVISAEIKTFKPQLCNSVNHLIQNSVFTSLTLLSTWKILEYFPERVVFKSFIAEYSRLS